MVINCFVVDSFMWFVVMDYGCVLFCVFCLVGFMGVFYEILFLKLCNWILFDVVKLIYFGVQVFLGEVVLKWQVMIVQWIDFILQYSGLWDGFKMDYVEVYIYVFCDMGFDNIEKGIKELVFKNYFFEGDLIYQIYNYEFFDVLILYVNVIMFGVVKIDLYVFWESQRVYDKFDWEIKLYEYVWFVDIGLMFLEFVICFEGMVGECIWGCVCWVVVFYDQFCGDKLFLLNCKVICEEVIVMMIKIVVKMLGGEVKKFVKVYV